MKTANYDGDNKRFILIKQSLPSSRGKEVFRLKSFIEIFSYGDADQQPLQSHTRVTEKLIFGNQLAAINAVAVLPRRIMNEVEMMTQHQSKRKSILPGIVRLFSMQNRSSFKVFVGKAIVCGLSDLRQSERIISHPLSASTFVIIKNWT